MVTAVILRRGGCAGLEVGSLAGVVTTSALAGDLVGFATDAGGRAARTTPRAAVVPSAVALESVNLIEMVVDVLGTPTAGVVAATALSAAELLGLPAAVGKSARGEVGGEGGDGGTASFFAG